MFVDKKGLNKAFRLGLFGLYALGFGLTVGVRSAEYVNVIGDYNPYNVSRVLRTSNGVDYALEQCKSFTDKQVVYNGKYTFTLDQMSHYSGMLMEYNQNGYTGKVAMSDSNVGYYCNDYFYYTSGFDTGYSHGLLVHFNVNYNRICFSFLYDDIWSLPLSTEDAEWLGVNSIHWDGVEFKVNNNNSSAYIHYNTKPFTNINSYTNSTIGSLPLNSWCGYRSDLHDATYSQPSEQLNNVNWYFATSYTDFVSIEFSFFSFLNETTDYSNGYNQGFTDGTNDVLSNPNNYDLVTYADYLAYGQAQYNQGLEAGSNVLSMSGVMNAIFTAPISMFAQIFRSGAFVWTMPTGEVLDLGGLMTFFLTIGIALAVVRLILKVGSK